MPTGEEEGEEGVTRAENFVNDIKDQGASASNRVTSVALTYATCSTRVSVCR